MKILALDTSSTACSVALLNGDKIETLHKIAPMQQTKLILPMIDELLTSQHLSLQALDAIAYGVGPGSFTGIRIANSVAQGLAYAIQKPLIQISSLAAAALSAYHEKQWTKLLVSIDARMDKTYWAAYEIKSLDCVELISEEQLCAPDQITVPEGENWCGIGDGWEKYQESLLKRLKFKPLAINPLQIATAKAILQLAKPKFERGEWVKVFDANPTYFTSS